MAAYVVLAGVALFDLGLATNWLQGVKDGFGEKSLGNKVSAVGTPLVIVGTGILFYGVATAL